MEKLNLSDQSMQSDSSRDFSASSGKLEKRDSFGTSSSSSSLGLRSDKCGLERSSDEEDRFGRRMDNANPPAVLVEMPARPASGNTSSASAQEVVHDPQLAIDSVDSLIH